MAERVGVGEKEVSEVKGRTNMTRDELIRDIIQNATLVHSVQRPPYTFCQLHYSCQDVNYLGGGFSKMRPGDTWNDRLGRVKAQGRAVSDLYQQVVAAGVEL